MTLAVAAVTALLIAAARWAGRPVAPGGVVVPAAGRAAGDGSGTVAAGALGDDATDLSFYMTLGKSPAKGAGHGPAAADRVVHPADGTRNPAGAYIVQALGTRDPAQARRVRDRLAGRGLPATIVEGEAGGAPAYRVRVGRYRERSAAEAMARRVRAEAGLSPWVLQEAE